MGNSPSLVADAPADPVTHDRRALQRLHAQLCRVPHVQEDSIRLEAVNGRHDALAIKFRFSGPATCRITTFTLATESEKTGQITTTSATIPGLPVLCKEGHDQQFPGGPHSVHVINVRAISPTFLRQRDGLFPVVIRMESLSRAHSTSSYDLRTLPLGTRLSQSLNAHTLLGKLAIKPDGGWELVILERRLWIDGVCHSLPPTSTLLAAVKAQPPSPRLASGPPEAPPAAPGHPYSKPHLKVPRSPPRGLSPRRPRRHPAPPPAALCVCCGARPLSVVVLPCHHSSMCMACAVRQRMQHNRCPTCWQGMGDIIPIAMADFNANYNASRAAVVGAAAA